MPGTNNFQVFNPGLANAETDAQYTADSTRTGGISTGLASPTMHNKLFRQVSVMAAAIGQFVANQGYNASDTDLTALTGAVTNAVKSANTEYGLDPFILQMLAQ